MKICEKCGKEIADEILECPNCSIMPLYEQALKNAKAMNIVAIALIVVAIICALFVNAWFGAILCLVAELVCLIPNTKVQKLFKKNNVGTSDKKKLKADSKALIKDLKTKNKNYKLSFLVATIALILLIAFVCVDSTLTGLANSLPSDLQEDDYGSGIVNQIDTIVDLHQYANSDFYNYGHNSSDNSSVQAHKGFVGTWEHSSTTNSNTGKEVVPEEPFLEEMEISEWNTVTLTYYGTQEIFNCDGVWTSNEFTDQLIDVTVTETNGKTELHAKTYSLTYHEEQDYIGIVDGDLVHIYSRVGETSSNTTTQSSTSSNNSSSHEKEPIVGSFDYFESRGADTMTAVTISCPYISHMNFEADGTGNLTLKTDTGSGFSVYTTTWELVESSGSTKKYDVHTNTNETINVFYDGDLDICTTFGTLNGETVVNIYQRYSGNAQDNMSGATTSGAYDIIGSFCFTHAYNPNTGYKTSNPSLPYTYYLTFYEGNSCLVQAKTGNSSNAYGIEFYNGSWRYETQESGDYYYTLILTSGSTNVEMAVLYMSEDDVCVVSDTSGIYYYLARVDN